MIQTLYIPGWIPTPLNKLLNNHWAKAGRLKAKDREVIDKACVAHDMVPCGEPFPKRRRVDLLVVWPKGKRSADKDAFWKSTLDALVQCGMLANDSAKWCEPGLVQYAKGEAAATFIILQDV